MMAEKLEGRIAYEYGSHDWRALTGKMCNASWAYMHTSGTI